MDEDLLMDWITALRSGDYEQCRKIMRCEDGYCCLGVFCDVVSKRGIGGWKGFEYDYEGVCSMGVPPIELREKIRLPLKLTQDCIRWNDDDNLNFNDIADKLEGWENNNHVSTQSTEDSHTGMNLPVPYTGA